MPGCELLGHKGPQGATVTVVGGGASGVELAAHLSVRSDVVGIRLVESGTKIGADLPEGGRKRIEQLLARRGVAVHTGCVVRDLGERQLVCDDDTVISHDVVGLAAGLTAPPCSPSSGSATGAGSRCGQPFSTSTGTTSTRWVTAHASSRVRCPASACTGSGKDPCCCRALLARLRGEPLPVYEPRRRTLSILDLGDGVGLAAWGQRWWYGAAALQRKRYIDRRWLRTYQE